MPVNATTGTMQHQQRRMFRGRGGANDRRLPKHQARRRRRHHAASQEAAENSDSEGRLYHLDSNSHFDAAVAEDFFSSGDQASGETDDDDTNQADGEESSALEDNSSSPANALSIMNITDETEAAAVAAASTGSIVNDATTAALRQEMTHLRQRISNIQGSFHSLTLADLATYQTNVLNAVLNCVAQWRSIVQHYVAALSPADGRRAGQATFELVQASLQTGPLRGGKPGYFARCGSAVAGSVHTYLRRICTSPADAVTDLYWTEKQAAAWQTWTRKAAQAASADTAPSASVQKKQHHAVQRKQAKQAKRQAKREQLGLG